MEAYKHKVQYYETDKMGIVHHSNYIRWMEEARTDFLNRIGWDYEKVEAQGIISPVSAVEGKYLRPTTFGDTVAVKVWVEDFKGAKLCVGYEITNEKGEEVFKGRSEHGFLKGGKIISLRREAPELYEILASQKADE